MLGGLYNMIDHGFVVRHTDDLENDRNPCDLNLDSIEDRIYSWLEERGVHHGSPTSKSEEYFESNRQAIMMYCGGVS